MTYDYEYELQHLPSKMWDISESFSVPLTQVIVKYQFEDNKFFPSMEQRYSLWFAGRKHLVHTARSRLDWKDIKAIPIDDFVNENDNDELFDTEPSISRFDLR